MTEHTFEGVGGLKIFTRAWEPQRKARAVVVIVHGFNAHSGYYEWAADQLVGRGFAVHALDLRGRGRSEGERWYVDRFADYVDDVATFVSIVKQREPGLPVFLLGHSAGGVVACMYALQYQSELAGLICESFAHEIPASDISLGLLKGLSLIAPHAHVLKLRNQYFSRDPKHVEHMNNDPMIAKEKQPTQTVAEMVRADERLRKAFPNITLPLLILHGTADQATKPSGSKRFHALAGSKDKTLKLYEGHAHDLLNDLERDVVMNDIVGWLDSHVATPARAMA